jgi:hypothetical protein
MIKDLSVGIVWHRLKLLDAIAALRSIRLHPVAWKTNPMMNDMMNWWMGGMSVVWLLIVVVLVLAAAALIKYLFTSR